MNGLMLLMAANPAKLIALLAPLVIFVVFILFVVASGKQAQRRAQSKPRQTGPKFPDRSRSSPPPTRPQPLRNDEIQDFLRRAAGQRKEQAASRAESPGRGRDKQTPRSAVRPADLRRENESGVPADVDDPPRPASTLSQGVASRLSTRQFDDRVSHIVHDRARAADIEREQQRQQRLSHHVGRLSDSEGGPSGSVTDTAATIEAAPPGWGLLLSADSAKMAIVLTEIFNRPEHRW